jgi:hypothetical protein
MKHKMFTMLATTTLLMALAAPVAVPAPKPKPAPAAVPAPEPHPEIREALESLRHARVHLAEARHDFGGHKAEAIRATDEAMHQLEICLKFDR